MKNKEVVKLGEYLYIKGRIGWKGLKKDEYLLDSDYRIINGESLSSDGIDWKKAGYISKERYDESPEIMLKINDILLSKDGTIGKIGYVKQLDKPSSVASGIFVIRNERPKEIDTKFIYYYLISPYFKSFITMRTEGSVIPHLYQKDFEELDFPLYDLVIQKRIVSILQSIDDKIELNNKINKNLLNQGALLFDKIYGLGKPTTLNSLLDIVESGSRPKGGAESQGIPSLGAEKIECFGTYDFSSEKYISNEFYQNLKRGKVLSGDILLYKDGAYTGKVSMSLDDFPHKKCAINEHVFIIRTKKNFAQFFLYFLLSKNENKQQIIAMASSKAAQPGLNSQELANTNILLPDNKTISEFESTISPLMHRIASNAKENKNLITLRDSLLPKLMSGEIDVSKIDI